VRNGGNLHRDAIGFTSVQVPATPTLADVTTGGSLLAATAYTIGVVSANANGYSGASTLVSQTTASDASNTHAVRITLAQSPGATSYHIFIFTGGTAQWVGNVTEAQRAAGGAFISAVNTVGTGGPGSAGTIDVRVSPTASLTALTTAFTAQTWSPDVLIPTLIPTGADVATGGLLAANANHAWVVSPYNRFGVVKGFPSFAIKTANDGNATHCVRITIPQVSGAEGYDVFVSAANAGGNPSYVGRITEAQRAAGAARISAVGVTDASGAGGAGTVDVCVVGTGVTSAAAPFTTNSAFIPATVAAIGQVSCAGFSKAHVYVKVSLADLRVSPSIVLLPFEANQVSGSDWANMNGTSMTVGMSGTATLLQSFTLAVDGATDLVILLSTLTGQTPAVSVWVELC
jgi:hypothetical protein